MVKKKVWHGSFSQGQGAVRWPTLVVFQDTAGDFLFNCWVYCRCAASLLTLVACLIFGPFQDTIVSNNTELLPSHSFFFFLSFFFFFFCLFLYDHIHVVWQQLKPQLHEQGERTKQAHPSQCRGEAVWIGSCLLCCSEDSGGLFEITLQSQHCCQAFSDAQICYMHICRGLFFSFFFNSTVVAIQAINKPCPIMCII